MYDPFLNYDQMLDSHNEDCDDGESYDEIEINDSETIDNPKDLGVKFFSADPSLKESDMISWIEKCLYRQTNCGAWIKFFDFWVIVGSIVEGSDAEFSEILSYPFTKDDFQDTINNIEDLVSDEFKSGEYYGDDECEDF